MPKRVVEDFDNLRESLQDALQAKHGKGHYLDEFSHKEVIFSKPGAEHQYIQSYSTDNGGVTLTGRRQKVRRVSGYERLKKAAVDQQENKADRPEKAAQESNIES